MEEKKYYENLKNLTHATFCFENEDHTLGKPAIDILKESLDDLGNMCDIMLNKFNEALKQS
ncbi:hypothetical protein PFFVO_04771 [Plasmodium falciparum Vietnam Oak-Knoll (FVO)]|uniref:DNA-directed RNA polymerase RBP11-like dimerisation domain-containing protein n=1 Tax=Plasmodium falciparum Vietnam Oak-Knoll (FVO) TaxID=1036723 RepID=A0A024V124_PLAFA|nr:hypothetical protein PFFVO_04771 [Plasmodium falciparum Vietnam Oak-Knoll (FVO)]